MIGDIYSIPIKGAQHNNPHLHVIVIEISGSKEYVCVPAFSVEGVKVYLENVEALGLSGEAACVELDNSEMVTFTAPGYTGKHAYWLVERFRRISKSVVRDCELIGEMKEEGLAAIAGGLLALNEQRPETFSGPILKRIRKLASAASESWPPPS